MLVLAQNKSILHMSCTWQPLFAFQFYEGTNAIVFRRSIAIAIALVVTSRSSSLEYTISVHAVHAGAERNVQMSTRLLTNWKYKQIKRSYAFFLSFLIWITT